MILEERKQWNENHKKLTNLILNPAEHENAVNLFLDQHACLFSSQMEGASFLTLEDELLQNIKETTLRKYPVTAPDTSNSIVWHIWHITRIEDMTMNVLVNGQDQVFDSDAWADCLNIKYLHTGNGMTEEEVADLSSKIDIGELLSYRMEVGRRTRDIVRSLKPGQMKQKVDPARITKLKDQGAVKEEAAWLLDYWGNKTVAGLILMPATRHHFVHLNKSMRIKQKLQKD